MYISCAGSDSQLTAERRPPSKIKIPVAHRSATPGLIRRSPPILARLSSQSLTAVIIIEGQREGRASAENGGGDQAEQRVQDADHRPRRVADGGQVHPRPPPLRHQYRLPPLRLRRCFCFPQINPFLFLRMISNITSVHFRCLMC